MREIFWNPDVDNLPEHFGLTLERAHELRIMSLNLAEAEIDKALELFEADGRIDTGRKTSVTAIFPQMIRLAESENEQNWIIFLICEIHSNTDDLAKRAVLKRMLKF